MTKKLFKYTGIVSEIEYKNSGEAINLVLRDMDDAYKAPIAIKAYGKLATYINALSWTDAEEKYLNRNWYYDDCLMLHHIEIPGNAGHVPAKIIAVKDVMLDDTFTIFGEQDLIEAIVPESMGADEYHDWLSYQSDCEYRYRPRPENK